ncbi:MAG: Re/Si-specific NAD(P)(+) transhydrogenase subunit alpha [Alphaproteobacteria bacterium]|nr:Re/Si-specific NAD(P)(+) transhydrogenase subunit alpha [Alphaproteobacteria bacterium]
MNVFIPRERAPDETRVAATPETVKKMLALKLQVSVEAGAGTGASFTDHNYAEAGATIVSDAAKTAQAAQIILCVNAPYALKDIALSKDALIIGLMNAHEEKEFIAGLHKSGAQGLAMELVPRITRAQPMDVLSSQANLAGYRAVLEAAHHYGRIFPMMMTAAGTLPPAKAFIMGAGVAGLQAIATARRLGAIVSATDVRPASKEQVQSLGASFIAVEDEEFKQAETAGGYAKEMSAEYKKKQQALIEEHIAKQDIVITTALIPGRAAPVLITKEMVARMKPGAVIADLAAVNGGNCALTQPGKIIVENGVTIIGHRNFPSLLAADASALYARNVLALLQLIIDKESGALKLNTEDDIIKAILLKTKEGA